VEFGEEAVRCLELRWIDGCPVAEIARETNREANAISCQLVRLKRRARALLQFYGGEGFQASPDDAADSDS